MVFNDPAHHIPNQAEIDRNWKVLFEKLIAKAWMKSTLLKVMFKLSLIEFLVKQRET